MSSVESIKPGGSRPVATQRGTDVVGHTDATGRVPPVVGIETDALGGSRPVATVVYVTPAAERANYESEDFRQKSWRSKMRMVKTTIAVLMLFTVMVASTALFAIEETVASGASGRIAIDTESYADSSATIALDATSDAVKVTYSACGWNTSAAMGSCSLYDNGALVASFDGEGEFSWAPPSYGAHVLSLSVDGGETLQRRFFKDYPVDFVVGSSSSPISMDTRAGEGTLTAKETEKIAWSGLWAADANADVSVTVNGESFVSGKGEGVETWTPTAAGTYTFQHTTAGITETLTATFVVEAKEIETKLNDAFEGKPVAIVSDGNGGWIVTITNDVNSADLPIEIPDNIGPVTIDLNGHNLVGADGEPAIRIVLGGGEGSPTVLTVITTGGDAVVQGGEGAPAVEVADGTQEGVAFNFGEDVIVRSGIKPEIRNVTAKQRYPWNGLVDITCEVVGIDGTTDELKFVVAAVDTDSGTTNKVSHFWVVKDGTNSTDYAVHTNGNYRLLWDARAELGQMICSNMVVRVSLEEDDGHEKVQLWENGPYWAKTNIGAEESWERGYYFWWGDTIGYKRENNAWVSSDGSSSNFSFSDGNTHTCEKGIDILKSEGWITADSTLVPEHDAAFKQWGGRWRMPTDQELVDLCDKCDWFWTTSNGIYGCVVRGKGDYSLASIFLPAAGSAGGTSLNSFNTFGNYWSSVPYTTNNKSWGLGFMYFVSSSTVSHNVNYDVNRSQGRPVRPVQGFIDNAVPAELMGDTTPFLLDTVTSDVLDGLPVTIEPDGVGGWIVTLTNDVDSVDLPIEIPDNIGPVTIDLNGHNLVGADAEPAMRIVPGGGEGSPTVLTVITTGGDAVVQGGEGAPAVEVVDGTQEGASFNSGDGVVVRSDIKPEIRNVIAKQRYPWNGLVDITCEVFGIDGTTDELKFVVAAVDTDSGTTNKVSHFWVVQAGTNSTDYAVHTNGDYRLLWDARADLGQVICSNMIVRVSLEEVHKKVQLWEGGPYWATTNIGAENPEDYGYYFWWGDTIGYKHENEQWVASDGSTSNFSFGKSTTPTYNKSIATLKSEGWITVDELLALEHDAARAHWCGAWRMPTDQELSDLRSKCAWTKETMNGVNGWGIRGRGDYASASIFLPYAGYGNGTSLYGAGSDGDYWSSVPYWDSNYNSWLLGFNSGGHDTSNYYRLNGLSVRPVQGFTESAVIVVQAGESVPFQLDTKDGSRESEGIETLTYSSFWDGDANATVTIAQDGVAIAEGLTGEGEWNWSVSRNGTYVLTHTTYTNGVAGVVETATFVVTGKDVPFADGDVVVTGYSDAYDGAAHGVGVAAREGIDEVVVRYAVDTGGGQGLPALPWADVSPTLTDVGSMAVWCEISAPGYITQTNSATIRITQATNAWTTLPTMAGWTYGQAPSEPDMGEAKFGTASVAYTVVGSGQWATRPTEPGDYVAVFAVAETANWSGLTNEVPFKITAVEETRLEEAFDGLPVSIESDGEGGWIVTITNDIDSADLPIEIPDNVGPVTIDLNGHDLVGGDGQPVVQIVSGEGDGEPTVITIVNLGDDATMHGGEGSSAIVVDEGTQDGVVVNIGEGVIVQGGGDGVPGIIGEIGTNSGVILPYDLTEVMVGEIAAQPFTGDAVTPALEIYDAAHDVTLVEGTDYLLAWVDNIWPGIATVTVTGKGNYIGEVTRMFAIGTPVEHTLTVGEYFYATLAELGYNVPTNGTPYSVVAKGLPAGLKLKYNPAWKNKKGKVVIKAKSEWWIEGVPTVAMDFFTNPPYLVITVGGVAGVHALPIEVVAQDVVVLEDLALGQSVNEQFYLPGVTNGWTVSGLPSGLKYTAKRITEKLKSGKKTMTVTKALPYSVYGKTTKAGLFTITAKKKTGAYYETLKYRVLVTPKAVDTAVFGEELTNITTMAYVPVDWDLTGDGRARSPSGPQSEVNGAQSNVDGGRLGEAALPSVAAVGGNVAKVTGLPAGVTFAAKDTYAYKNAKKKTGKYLKQYGQTIVGKPTKPGTYVVTFTKNVKSGKKTVAKTAQILWKVVANDAEVELGFNKKGGVVESGVVGLKYGNLMAFTATSNATVTASGLPAGMKLKRLDDKSDEYGGRLGEAALPGEATYVFTGFTTKAGTYLVTVTATLNGRTVTQRVALKVGALPVWAKGTYNGCVWGTGNGEWGTGGSRPVATNGLATLTVSSAGKISGKLQENGTNWTFTAASYTDGRARSPSGPQSQVDGSQNNAESGTRDACPYQTFVCSNVVAKYSWKVKSGKKTVTKTLTRTFALTVSPVPVVPNVPDVPIRGYATLTETAATGDTDATGRVPPEVTEIKAWQNLWGSTYKAVGKKLFTSKSGKKTLNYKVFAYEVYTNETGKVYFKDQDGNIWDADAGRLGEAALPGDGDKTGLTYFINLSLKVTTVGAVTATLTFDTGKTKKSGKKMVPVYYKPTCATVVIPTSAADAEQFTGKVHLYFAPSAAHNFPGFAAAAPL